MFTDFSLGDFTALFSNLWPLFPTPSYSSGRNWVALNWFVELFQEGCIINSLKKTFPPYLCLYNLFSNAVLCQKPCYGYLMISSSRLPGSFMAYAHNHFWWNCFWPLHTKRYFCWVAWFIGSTHRGVPIKGLSSATHSQPLDVALATIMCGSAIYSTLYRRSSFLLWFPVATPNFFWHPFLTSLLPISFLLAIRRETIWH